HDLRHHSPLLTLSSVSRAADGRTLCMQLVERGPLGGWTQDRQEMLDLGARGERLSAILLASEEVGEDIKTDCYHGQTHHPRRWSKISGVREVVGAPPKATAPSLNNASHPSSFKPALGGTDDQH